MGGKSPRRTKAGITPQRHGARGENAVGAESWDRRTNSGSQVHRKNPTRTDGKAERDNRGMAGHKENRGGEAEGRRARRRSGEKQNLGYRVSRVSQN